MHWSTTAARRSSPSDLKIKSQPAYSAWAEQFLLFALFFAGLMLLHAPLLRLPYFWDEAGYYIPAARDLYLTGTLIPQSTPSNAHPPLVMAWLALAWRVFRLLYAGHAHCHAGFERILAAGIVSTFANRRQFARGLGNNRAGRAVSGVLHAEFPGAGRLARGWIYLLGTRRLYRRPSAEANALVPPGSAG